MSMRRVNLHRAVVLVLCGLSLGAPASAAAAGGCPATPVSQVFLPWGDLAWYAPVPDGGMEVRQGAWTLDGAAAFTAGNEPYFVGSPLDRWSLALPSGSSAASAPTCVGLGHPALRLFARNVEPPGGRLTVAVEFTDPRGVRRSERIALLSGTGAWAPTTPILIVANTLSLMSAQQVDFRFTAAGGRWLIDDVYVDPYGKG
jgi:hypothetical protein